MEENKSDHAGDFVTAELDRRWDTSAAPAIPTQPSTPDFGAFEPRNYAGISQITDRFDRVTRFVSVYASAAARVQLGTSLDLGSSIVIPAGQGVLLPAQGVRSVTVKAATTADIVIVWHDDPIKIWS